MASLQRIQDQAGFIPDEAIALLAAASDATEAEVRGLIEFYRSLRSAPPGRHRICVCRGDSCAATGARGIADAVESQLAVIADASVTVESVHCLGACALSPAISIDADVHGRLTPDEIPSLLGEVKRG